MSPREYLDSIEGFASYIPKETLLSVMSMALKDVDINDAAARCAAYVRANYTDQEIIEHDAECLRRERIRRSITALREKATA
jgi:uncharacterized protein with PhoU and TrkA domain